MANPLFLFDNRFRDGVITTPDMQPWGGFPWGYYPYGGLQQADYLADYRDFLPWEAQDTGAQNISVRCGTPKPASAIGISGHNLKTAGVLISVEGSNDNFLSDVHTILAASTPFLILVDRLGSASVQQRPVCDTRYVLCYVFAAQYHSYLERQEQDILSFHNMFIDDYLKGDHK